MILRWLTDPFQLAIQQRALAEVVIAGGLGGLLGCYVVLRRLGFMTDAMAHAVLPGVVIAFLAAGTSAVLYGAMVAGAGAAAVIGLITRDRRIRQDAAIGIVLSGGFALGVVLISTVRSYASALEDFLFGNVLLVSPEDLALTLVVAALVAASIMVLHRRLMLRAFDPEGSEAMGLNGLALDLFLLLLLAGTVVVSLRAIGNILVVAFLITPAATARLLTDRVPAMMLTSALIGSATGVAGLVLAYHLNVASGSFIVCLSTLVFLVLLVVEPRRGLIARRLRGRSSGAPGVAVHAHHGH